MSRRIFQSITLALLASLVLLEPVSANEGQFHKNSKTGPMSSEELKTVAGFDNSLRLKNGDINILSEKVRYLSKIGRRQEALTVLEGAILKKPTEAKLYKLKADIHEDLKNPQSMLNDLNKAIELDPQNGEYYGERARVYFVLDSFDIIGSSGDTNFENKALADIQKGLSLSPGCAKLYGLKGRYLLEKGKTKEALVLVNKAIALDKNETQYYLTRCLIYSSQDNWQKAKEDADNLIRLAPRRPDNYFKRAKILERLNKPKEALADLDQSLKLREDNTEARAERIQLNMRSKSYKEVIADCDYVISRSPKDEEVLKMRGDAFMNMGNWEQAAADYSKAINLSPNLPTYYLARAEAYRRGGKTKLSAIDLERAARLKAEKPH